jgi:hypothetical protein
LFFIKDKAFQQIIKSNSLFSNGKLSAEFTKNFTFFCNQYFKVFLLAFFTELRFISIQIHLHQVILDISIEEKPFVLQISKIFLSEFTKAFKAIVLIVCFPQDGLFSSCTKERKSV